MTVLAVVGLFLALSLVPLLEDKGELLTRLQNVEERNLHLTELVKEQKRHTVALQGQLREAARNEKMFNAIQQAQRIVDELSSARDLRFSADQTLHFGDDIVDFPLNRYDLQWRSGGQERLRRFCLELTRRLRTSGGQRESLFQVFTVHVEGHTDSSQCPGDPNCNWWLSSIRAASFVNVMRQEEFCPGGHNLDLRPVGFADTRPYAPSPQSRPMPTRRIALRVVPNYENIIAEAGGYDQPST